MAIQDNAGRTSSSGHAADATHLAKSVRVTALAEHRKGGFGQPPFLVACALLDFLSATSYFAIFAATTIATPSAIPHTSDRFVGGDRGSAPR
jgi:hypothetical protein